jgi:hypothetical protein
MVMRAGSISSRIDLVCHQNRVDVLSTPAVVASAKPFANEAELLVESDRGLIVRKDVELELPDARRSRPLDGLLEQRPTDSPAAVGDGHHQAEVGDVAAGWMRVARKGQATDDACLDLGDEHGGVGVPADCAQIAALCADRPPPSVRDEPRFGLASDRLGERNQLRRVSGLGTADPEAARGVHLPLRGARSTTSP